MGKFQDLTGKRFGRLTAISRDEIRKNRGGFVVWNCLCDCGKTTTVTSGNLKTGNTQSCGCLQAENRVKHGLRHLPINAVYSDMLQRCNNSNHVKYADYGGRGICVHDCIPDLITFYNYVSKLPHYGEPGYTLDRIDNDGNYCICANNLRWSDKSTQSRNQRISRNNKTGVRGVHIEKRLENMLQVSDTKEMLYI